MFATSPNMHRSGTASGSVQFKMHYVTGHGKSNEIDVSVGVDVRVVDELRPLHDCVGEIQDG